MWLAGGARGSYSHSDQRTRLPLRSTGPYTCATCATIHLLGLVRKLTYRYGGRDFRPHRCAWSRDAGNFGISDLRARRLAAEFSSFSRAQRALPPLSRLAASYSGRTTSPAERPGEVLPSVTCLDGRADAASVATVELFSAPTSSHAHETHCLYAPLAWSHWLAHHSARPIQFLTSPPRDPAKEASCCSPAIEEYRSRKACRC
jgi:hypothetical protein